MRDALNCTILHDIARYCRVLPFCLIRDAKIQQFFCAMSDIARYGTIRHDNFCIFAFVISGVCCFPYNELMNIIHKYNNIYICKPLFSIFPFAKMQKCKFAKTDALFYKKYLVVCTILRQSNILIMLKLKSFMRKMFTQKRAGAL